MNSHEKRSVTLLHSMYRGTVMLLYSDSCIIYEKRLDILKVGIKNEHFVQFLEE